MTTTDEANANELEHDDGRGDPARSASEQPSETRTSQQASEERTTTDGEYQPKVSNVFGHMNCGDYFPDDETQLVESAPLSTLKAFGGGK